MKCLILVLDILDFFFVFFLYYIHMISIHYVNFAHFFFVIILYRVKYVFHSNHKILLLTFPVFPLTKWWFIRWKSQIAENYFENRIRISSAGKRQHKQSISIRQDVAWIQKLKIFMTSFFSSESINIEFWSWKMRDNCTFKTNTWHGRFTARRTYWNVFLPIFH